MSNPISDFQLFCACGVSYDITSSTQSGTDLPQDTFYQSAGFQSPPQIFQGSKIFGGSSFPDTAACLVGRVGTEAVANAPIVIAFRGTEYNSISDWATDLFVEPYTPAGFPSGAAVHAGFYFSTMELIPQLQTYLNGLSIPVGTAVYFTGHSKGGAMAYLASYLLYSGLLTGMNAADVTITTFASPIPGNTTFNTSYQNLFQNETFNYVNNLDIVPFLPPTKAISKYIISQANNSIISSLMSNYEQWQYYPCYTNVNYINSASAITYTLTDFFFEADLGSKKGAGYDDVTGIYDVVQTAIANKSITDLEKLLNAHSHAEDGGYWNALTKLRKTS